MNNNNGNNFSHFNFSNRKVQEFCPKKNVIYLIAVFILGWFITLAMGVSGGGTNIIANILFVLLLIATPLTSIILFVVYLVDIIRGVSTKKDFIIHLIIVFAIPVVGGILFNMIDLIQ